MEGSEGYKEQQELMLSSFGGKMENKVSVVVKDEGDVHCMKHQNEVVLPQSYFQFLTETSSFLHKSNAGAHVSQPIPQLGDLNSMCFGEGFPEFLTGTSYNYSGMASGSKSAYSLPDTFAWNLGMQPYLTHEGYPEASSNVNEFSNLLPNVRDAKLINMENQFGNLQHQSQAQSSWSQNPSENAVKSPHVSPKVKVSKSVIVPGSRKEAQKRKAFATDKQRRIRIAERIKALQELLPHPAAGSQTDILDDVVEYIKYLQHQMKELSQSRLGGEPNFGPLLFVEGHGHYIVLDQMMKEPLEEMVGKLIEFNPSGAAKLLETKGLFFDSYTK